MSMSPSSYTTGVDTREFQNAMHLFPTELRDMFHLIKRCKLLTGDDVALNRQIDGPEVDAIRDQDRSLCLQATRLAHVCNAYGNRDWSELTWLENTVPLVFQILDSRYEETWNPEAFRIYCSACNKPFADEARTCLNNAHDTLIDKFNSLTLGGNATDTRPNGGAHFCQTHKNVPSLLLQRELCYTKNGKREKVSGQRPDATIGLATFQLDSAPWMDPKLAELAEDDRVKYFDRALLGRIFKHYKSLEPPYVWDKKLTVPLFGFALYEAKKWDQGVDQAQQQSEQKLALLYNWQRDIWEEAVFKFETSKRSFDPVVWSFANAGASWTVHAMFMHSNRLYNVNLWRGNVAEFDEALQLLYIVQIVKFWADNTYIPVISACLQCLEAEMKYRKPTRIKDTLYQRRIQINEANVPWLFSRPNFRKSTSDLPIPDTLDGRSKSAPPTQAESLDRPSRGSQLATADPPPSRARTPNPCRGRSIRHASDPHRGIADKDIVWLLDHDNGTDDLLLVMIGSGPKRLKPKIFGNLEGLARIDVWHHIHQAVIENKHLQLLAILPVSCQLHQDGFKSSGDYLLVELEDILRFDELLKLVDGKTVDSRWFSSWRKTIDKFRFNFILQQVNDTAKTSDCLLETIRSETAVNHGHSTWAIVREDPGVILKVGSLSKQPIGNLSTPQVRFEHEARRISPAVEDAYDSGSAWSDGEGDTLLNSDSGASPTPSRAEKGKYEKPHLRTLVMPCSFVH